MTATLISTDGMKTGFTTGACAAAAAYGAVMAFSEEFIDEACIMNPKGVMMRIPVLTEVISGKAARGIVIKYSGDDPDITNGVRVISEAERIENGVEITGGEGIGIVTLAGLDQPVGEYAINSGPRKMIEEAVLKAKTETKISGGFRITVSIPGGDVLAEKTFNPRLGIKGGLSVLGTDGILRPMSRTALMDSVRSELSVKKAAGIEYVVLCPGKMGEDFTIQHLRLPKENIVQCSNFIGEAIDMACSMGFLGIIVSGHLGKLVKIGSGVFDTHSKTADARIETLMVSCAMAGADSSMICGLDGFSNTDSAVEYLKEHRICETVMEKLSQRIQKYLDIRSDILCGAVYFSEKHGILGRTEKAAVIEEKIRKW